MSRASGLAGLPRLRFAPSPTGVLHLGNARTALVNWLVARHAGGRLVLRIEDTDAGRSSSAHESALLADLRWLGIDWDEGPDVDGPYGPYRQSERLDRYREAAARLCESGAAYRCFCSPDELEQARTRARRAGATRCPGRCAELAPEQVKQRAREVEPAIRFAVPDDDVRFDDGLRGETGVGAGEISDFVILRADGRPTYNLAVVVDDHTMEIDQVIRGDDHLPNTPRQILLYAALGWESPAFTHLPLVLGTDRTRLSKRHGATSVAEMRAIGILPQALCNYLALLGWHPPGERELFRLDELRDLYDLSTLAKTSAAFDRTKLEWLNAHHLEALTLEELVRAVEPFRDDETLYLSDDAKTREWWGELLDLLRPRSRRLDELASAVTRLLYPEPEMRDTGRRPPPPDSGDVAAALAAFADASRRGELRDADGFRAVANAVAAEAGLRGKRLFHPLRMAISGEESGPELARLVPLIERGASLPVRPPIASVAERIESAPEAATRR